jgi:hypothetical protein
MKARGERPAIRNAGDQLGIRAVHLRTSREHVTITSLGTNAQTLRFRERSARHSLTIKSEDSGAASIHPAHASIAKDRN